MRALILIFGILAIPTIGMAQFQKRLLADSLFIPWGMACDRNDGLWFTQKNGFLCRLDLNTRKIDTLYFEQEVKISSEGGMLDLALHPDFPRTPFLYLAYNYEDGGQKLKIRRYEYLAGSHQVQPSILLLDGIQGGTYHNGCRLLIFDEHLYITTGDAGKPALAQDLNSLNGKTLRLELDGRIPLDNPLPLSPIWSWGHRNAQGMALVDGLIIQSEHGPDQDDELNWILPAGNYGWPEVMGYCDRPEELTFCRDSQVVEPLISWTPTLAVGDLIFYDRDQFPEWKGSLLLSTLKAEKLFLVTMDPSHTSVDTVKEIGPLNLGRIRALEIGPEGNLFLSTSQSPSLGNGPYLDQIWEIFNPGYTPGQVPEGEGSLHPSIYPNPFESKLFIQCLQPQSRPRPIRIMDLFGRTVYRARHPGGNLALDLEQLPPGTYILFFGEESPGPPLVQWIIKS